MSETPVARRARWEVLEEWLFDRQVESFTAVQLGADLGIPTREATRYIQAYLIAQRRPTDPDGNPLSRTLYVLKREGRTSSSVWSVGQRKVDARVIGETLFQDVRCKIERAFEPDLKRLAQRNPRLARFTQAKIAAVMDGALVVLASALDHEPDE